MNCEDCRFWTPKGNWRSAYEGDCRNELAKRLYPTSKGDGCGYGQVVPLEVWEERLAEAERWRTAWIQQDETARKTGAVFGRIFWGDERVGVQWIERLRDKVAGLRAKQSALQMMIEVQDLYG